MFMIPARFQATRWHRPRGHGIHDKRDGIGRLMAEFQTMRFDDITAPRPTEASLASEFAAITALLDAGKRPEAVAQWDAARRAYDTWNALMHLRFSQDTTSEAAKEAREYADKLAPVATGHEVAIKRRLLRDADRAGIEALVAKLVARRVPAVFAETSVPDRAVRALMEGAAARGHHRHIRTLDIVAISSAGHALSCCRPWVYLHRHCHCNRSCSGWGLGCALNRVPPRVSQARGHEPYPRQHCENHGHVHFARCYGPVQRLCA